MLESFWGFYCYILPMEFWATTFNINFMLKDAEFLLVLDDEYEYFYKSIFFVAHEAH